MSLSPSELVLVHDLQYLENMSQLVEENLLKNRLAPGGVGEIQGEGKCLTTQRSQGRGWLRKMLAGKGFPGRWEGSKDTRGREGVGWAVKEDMKETRSMRGLGDVGKGRHT